MKIPPRRAAGVSRLILAATVSLLAGSESTRAAAAEPDEPEAPRFAPTDQYDLQSLEGWTVLVHRGFLTDEPELAEQTLTHLRHQLYQIVHRLPEGAVENLRGIRIWVELAEPHHACAAYHPDADWLRDHDMNPDKAGCVELANARNFLAWTIDQPWMVLHELAHAYHHQSLEGGFDQAEVAAAYRAAVEEGRYAAVAKISGGTEPHYALTNPMEYFAEGTEAYFGTNDFYPFVRSELQEHDPRLHALLGELWGSSPPQ
jgi:hypothetical protein